MEDDAGRSDSDSGDESSETGVLLADGFFLGNQIDDPDGSQDLSGDAGPLVNGQLIDVESQVEEAPKVTQALDPDHRHRISARWALAAVTGAALFLGAVTSNR